MCPFVPLILLEVHFSEMSVGVQCIFLNFPFQLMKKVTYPGAANSVSNGIELFLDSLWYRNEEDYLTQIRVRKKFLH